MLTVPNAGGAGSVSETKTENRRRLNVNGQGEERREPRGDQNGAKIDF